MKTDVEIKKLSATLNALPVTPDNASRSEPGFTLQLTDAETDQIAFAYLAELEKQLQEAGGYRKGVNEANRDDALFGLARDSDRADAIVTGNDQSAFVCHDEDVSSAFQVTGFKQLARFEFIKQPSVVEPAFDGKRKRSRQGEPAPQLTCEAIRAFKTCLINLLKPSRKSRGDISKTTHKTNDPAP